MSNYDQWLESQGGCFDQLPSCQKCGYELCDHGRCPYCVGCAACDAEEEAEQLTKKPAVSVPGAAEQRKRG